jgi:6-phosphogluconate dehydrogenase
MEIGIIGLGRMGMNMARRLLRGRHTVIAYNRLPSKPDEIVEEGAIGAGNRAFAVTAVSVPRAGVLFG